MARDSVLPQAVGITALLAAGVLGVIANRWPGYQIAMVYFPPVACAGIGFVALVFHFSRRKRDLEPAAWTRMGVAIYALGIVTSASGFGLFVGAFGRRPTLPVHEGLLGVWVVVLGLGLLSLGRFVGRGSL